MKNCIFIFIFTAAFSASLHAEDVLLSPVEVIAPTYNLETVENKSGANIRDIPASIVIVPAHILEQQGSANFDDAMRTVSGLQPSNQGGYGFANNYKARGLGVSFLRDNINDGSTQNGYYRSLVDIQEIEVSKGPGSALFGSSAAGAGINLITKKPQREFALNAGASYGSFATRNVFTDVTGAISEGAAARLIVSTEKSNGYRSLERELIEFLPSISFDLSADRTLLLAFDYRKSQLTPDTYGIPFNFRRRLTSLDSADVSLETRYDTPFSNVDQTVMRGSAVHHWHINDVFSMKTSLVYDTRDLDILRNVRGNAGNAAGQLIRRSLRDQSDDVDYLTLQNELNWAVNTGSIKHQLLAGIEYNNARMDSVRQGYSLPNIANINKPMILETGIAGLAKDQSRSFNRKLKSDTYSIYLQDQIALSDQWKLRANLRNDHVSAQDKGIETTLGYRELSYTKNLTTGSLGLVYQPIQNLSFYTGYSEGAFIDINTETTALPDKPETSKQIEIGAKTSLFDNKLDLNVALFKTEREHYIYSFPETQSTPDGKDESRGLEIDFIAKPLSNLTFTGNAVWLDPEVKANTTAGINALGIANVSVKGTDPIGVSRRSASLWANYAVESLPGLELGLGSTYRSTSYIDALNVYQVPAYVVIDASVRYKMPSTNKGLWEVGLFVKNLANKEYYYATTNIGALPGDERSAFLNVKFSYK